MAKQTVKTPHDFMYVARKPCGCAIAMTLANEHLEHIALTVAKWILDGSAIEQWSIVDIQDAIKEKRLTMVCSHVSHTGNSQRKFFKTLHLVISTTEDHSIEGLNIEDLADEIDIGSSVGQLVTQSDNISPAEAARLLINMNSDPAFFRLDRHGNDDFFEKAAP